MEIYKWLISAAFLAASALSNASNADNATNLIKNAIATFEQRKPDLPLLYAAAETGDKEAQFYLAETLRMASSHITAEAQLWYEKSAKQDDMYSMYRLSTINQDLCAIMENCPAHSLSPEKWSEKLLNFAQHHALLGDGEAMEMMYIITGDLDWLIKSAAAGYPSAQNWLAVRYEWGDGWFLWPGKREEEIERLYKVSAEGGYPRAIVQHAGNLLIKGDEENARKWLMKGVYTGNIISIGNYAHELQHAKYYKIKKNLKLSYALNLLLSKIGGGSQNNALYTLEELEPQLTPRQIKEAIQISKNWKNANPPLSYHPPKLEFW